MKHRLAPFLEGMEMSKSEHDWLEQRFERMTVKEEMLFRGAMQLEHPKTIQEAMQILQGLDHYRLLYGADDDISLGRFVMEHIHTPTHTARGYLDLEMVGAAYREHGSGSFVENHYVERLNPDRPLPEVNPDVLQDPAYPKTEGAGPCRWGPCAGACPVRAPLCLRHPGGGYS